MFGSFVREFRVTVRTLPLPSRGGVSWGTAYGGASSRAADVRCQHLHRHCFGDQFVAQGYAAFLANVFSCRSRYADS
jgi:hypothetical protein